MALVKVKVVVDRKFIDKRLAEAEEDIKKGRVSPAFSSAKAAIRDLHRQAKKLKKPLSLNRTATLFHGI